MSGDRPDAAELVEAVLEFLAEEVLPNAPDHRAKFRGTSFDRLLERGPQKRQAFGKKSLFRP